jgi:hypothetical protein
MAGTAFACLRINKTGSEFATGILAVVSPVAD